MSVIKNQREAERWMDTAAEDIVAAKLMAANKMYSHACFLAQQCGEKAIKAFWFMIAEDPWGHSVQKLIADFPQGKIIPDIRQWTEKGALLDRYYIPTRYPNGIPDLTPGVSYFQQDATVAIQTAKFFLSAVKDILHSAARKRSDKKRLF